LIDLHHHLLPYCDDGAKDMATALDMARAAVADGITTVACTPHILPGLYDNSGDVIRRGVVLLQEALAHLDIPLRLVTGSDAHMRPDFGAALKSGLLLSLNDSRYVLFEPPHHVLPPRLDECLFSIMEAGYVPILTHPERLTWIESHYARIVDLARRGVWMQITAASLTGRFGKRPKYWAEKMLSEGMIHILATDAHDLLSRPPVLSAARRLAEQAVGVDEARDLVETRPQGVLDNEMPGRLPAPRLAPSGTERGHWRAVLGRG